jgi:hypothetical protein
MTTVSIGIVLVKISVCLFLLRLATRRAQIWFLWGIIGFLVPFALAALGTLVCQSCSKLREKSRRLMRTRFFSVIQWQLHGISTCNRRPWARARPNASAGTPLTASDCSTEVRHYSSFIAVGTYGHTVINISTDFLLALLPVPLIWKLQMPLRTRLSLVAVLSLGIFAAVAGIIRQLSSSQFGVPEPYIYDTYSIWNFIELDMGIIAASLPALKPLFSMFRDTARSLTGKPTKSTGYRSGEGYQRQPRPVDEDGFALVEYGTKGEVKVSSRPKERVNGWTLDQAKSSEESILPQGEKPGKRGITVTKSVQVE